MLTSHRRTIENFHAFWCSIQQYVVDEHAVNNSCMNPRVTLDAGLYCDTTVNARTELADGLQLGIARESTALRHLTMCTHIDFQHAEISRTTKPASSDWLLEYVVQTHL